MSRRWLVAALAPTLLVITGCPNPEQKLADFNGRVIDAGQVVRIDAAPLEQVPDISGTFYMGLAPGFLPSVTIRMQMENTLTENGDGTATLDVTFTAIDKNTLELVGDPFSASGVAVNVAGELTIHLTDVKIPGQANPISDNDIQASFIDLIGVIRSTDLVCGDADGMVTSPIQQTLAGSTWGAIRVPPGTTGTDLPEVQPACPAGSDVDAGVPDAGAADAGAADAGAPDAAP